MNFKRLPAALAIASAIAVAACVPQAEEDTAPVSTPTPTPTPAPAPPQVVTPTYDNWMDAPVTQGTWRYTNTAGGTAAFFGEQGGGALFAMQCRFDSRNVTSCAPAPAPKASASMAGRMNFPVSRMIVPFVASCCDSRTQPCHRLIFQARKI